MYREPDTLIGLCVGTTKISVIVAEKNLRSREAVHIIGIGSAPSEGIRKGQIVNLEPAVFSITRAVKEAENIVGFKLRRAMVAFNAMDLTSVNTKGIVSLGRNAGPMPVTVGDVKRVIESAQTHLSVPMNKIPLHTIPVRYSIDGNFDVEDPLSMTGMLLEMNLQTVTVPTSCVHNVVRCVKMAGIEVDGLVVKPLASAFGALTAEEMKSGAISICVGGGVTGVTFYSEDRPIKVASLNIGGDHITSDLVTMLRLSLKKAEEIKKRILEPEEDDFVPAPRRQPEKVFVDSNKAMEVIAYRLEELFAVNLKPLISSYDPTLFPGGIVLSGGVANTPGIENLLIDIFQMPVRVADSQGYAMPPGRSDVSYASAVGIIRYMLYKERNQYGFIDAPRELWDVGEPIDDGEDEDNPGNPVEKKIRKNKKKWRVRETVKNLIEKIQEAFTALFGDF